MGLHDLPGDVEPQSEPRVVLRGRGPLEAAEDALTLFGVDAHAAVDHRHPDAFAVPLHADLHRLSLAELDGVGDQVAQDLLDADPVEGADHGRGRDHPHRRPVRHLRIGLVWRGHLARQRRHVHGLAGQLEPAEPDARQVEQCLHQPGEAAHLSVERVHPPPNRLGHRGPGSLDHPLEHLDLNVERGDRSPELMGGDGQELVASFDLFPSLAVEKRLGLDTPALGDVADPGDRPHALPGADGGEADLGGKLAPVLAKRREVRPHPHRARARRGVVPAAQSPVIASVPGRQQHLHGLSDHLLPVPAEEVKRRRVGEDDQSVRVGDDDAVGDELEEREVHGRLPDGAQLAVRPGGASKS